jgi:serine/threonine-protein kinase HipA
MTTELNAILDGKEMGRIVRDKRARLTFTCNEEWRTTENAYPLSISMPLALAQHGHARIDPFLWGLLPDNQMVLDQWAQEIPCLGAERFQPYQRRRGGLRGRGAVCSSRTA